MRTFFLALAGMLVVSAVGGWLLSRHASEELAAWVTSAPTPALARPGNGSKARPYAVASHDVVMYSAPGCHACESAAKWFARNRVPYTELNINSDAAQQKLRGRVVRRVTPTIDVDGQLVIGFDPGRLGELLDL